MACRSYCYVNSCNSYVAPNELWDYNVGEVFPTAVGGKVYEENIVALAASINDERQRRNGNVADDFPFDNIQGSDENPANGTLIYGNHTSQEMMKDIKTAINEISAGYVTYTITDGNKLTFAQINEARTKIDALRAACLCNSDCGGHLVCPCHGDCGCNYSDERLKRDIRSL